MPFPRDTYRSSMHGDDHGTWRGKWPTNLTAGGANTAAHPDDDSRRDMFSPFGRGRTSTGGQINESSRPRRSSSAPPRIARSLKDTLAAHDKGGNDPYATPVVFGKKSSQAEEQQADRSFSAAAAGERSVVTDVPPQPSNSNSNGGARDISAAVAKWSSRSLAELMTSRSVSNGENKVKLSEVNNALTPAAAPQSVTANSDNQSH
jgi:hypothetical protein